MAVLRRQVSVVLRAHTALFAIDAGFLVFESSGFMRSELSASVALSNASLLIALARSNVMALVMWFALA